MTPSDMGKFSISMLHLTFDQPQSPISNTQYPKMTALITKCDIVHQNDSTETMCNDFNKANGIKNIPTSIIHDLKRGKQFWWYRERDGQYVQIEWNWNYRESSAPSGNVPAIRSPQTTTYKMHVINNSIICAMLTNRAPTRGPKHTLAMLT